MVRPRAFAGSVCLLLVAVFSFGCKTAISRRAKDAEETREQTALSWVNALGDGDGPLLHTLTAEVFFFRTVGEDRRCEGRITGGSAFAAWLLCARARSELQELSSALKMVHQALREDPLESSELKTYLPRVVGGDDAWSRFVGSAERQRAQAAFDAARKEAGGDGAWTTVATSWLYTTMVLRLQLVGPADAPRVRAVLVDVARTAD